MGNNKNNILSWDDFAQLGNPDNVPEEIEPTEQEKGTSSFSSKVRVYLERKGRKGKTVTLIKGILADESQMITWAKELKAGCGVGGGLDENNIMLQGDQRKKVIEKLYKIGFKDVKNAGA